MLTNNSKDGLKKLNESIYREQLANYKVDQLQSRINELNIREKELRKSNSRLETTAEEAISANQALHSEIADLKVKLSNTQQAHEALLSTHNSVLSECKNLKDEYDKMKSERVEHEHEILRLNGLLNSRRDDESHRDLASFKAKSIAVMKQHIDGLKKDYARRLDDFKSSYVLEKENDKISLLELDLSNKKGENDILKRRIEQLQKSTSLKIQDAEDKRSRIQGELNLARDDVSKQREQIHSLQGELDHLRSLMDIAEESVGELN